MPIDYLAEFPISDALLPKRLRSLLTPVERTEPTLPVIVATRRGKFPDAKSREYDQMMMIAVTDEGVSSLGIPSAACDGVVSYSTPWVKKEGELQNYTPSTINGHDPIVASRGDGSFFNYALSEKVWMALGLSSRLVGGDEQRVVYDDLSLPEFSVASGEATAQHYFDPSRDVCWTISNAALRRYLWMRGMCGVRVFFYEALLQDSAGLRAVMAGDTHIYLAPDDGWYKLDVREHGEGLFVQVWATVVAVLPELCQELTANGLNWPDQTQPMTCDKANALVDQNFVYLQDRFLERYEQESRYNSVPYIDRAGLCHCNPSYLGQWDFTGCVRIGRNLIRVTMRDLYKPKPDREIVHAHKYAVSEATVATLDLNEEHMPSKTDRLVKALLQLGDLLAELSNTMPKPMSSESIVDLSRTRLDAEGFRDYPVLARLAQVAPLEMTEQAFLSRCKTLHEFWQRIPNGFLRDLVVTAGHSRKALKDFGSLKLLQALTNIVERLNEQGERLEAFGADPQGDDLTARNSAMAALFVNHDLRIADAHEAGGTLKELKRLNIDPAIINDGYGRALDLVYDRLINGFVHLNEELRQLLAR